MSTHQVLPILFIGFLVAPLGRSHGPEIFEPKLESAVNPRVGRVHVELDAWPRIARERRESGGFGADSLQATVVIRGREIDLVANWEAGAAHPSALVASVRGTAEVVPPATLTWRDVVPNVMVMASVDLAIEGGPTVTLLSQAGKFQGTWYEHASSSARFQVDGEDHLAWLVDGDLDGRLTGPDDRWIAGPASALEKLDLQNPREEMRPLAEPWCFGEHSLRLIEERADRAVIESGPPVARGELLARHYERVQADFARNLPARSLMLEKQGDDPDRPAAVEPLTWHFAPDLDDALAFAHAQKRPLLVEFTSFSCGFCRLLSYITHPDAEVDRELRRFGCVKIIAESDPEKTYRRLGVSGFPCTALVNEKGEIVERLDGFKRPSEFAATIRAWGLSGRPR